MMAVGGFGGFPWLLTAQTIISLSELQQTIDQRMVWRPDRGWGWGSRGSVPNLSNGSHGRSTDTAQGSRLREWNGLTQGQGDVRGESTLASDGDWVKTTTCLKYNPM